MDRDGLSRRAALSEGWGDGTCVASVVQAGLIFIFASGWHSSFFSLVDEYV